MRPRIVVCGGEPTARLRSTKDLGSFASAVNRSTFIGTDSNDSAWAPARTQHPPSGRNEAAVSYFMTGELEQAPAVISLGGLRQRPAIEPPHKINRLNDHVNLFDRPGRG
jgi:hypothetical protein